MNAELTDSVAGCSNYNSAQNKELEQLKLPEGINVWGTNQDILEKQALNELEIFQESIQKEKTKPVENRFACKTKSNGILDVDSFIKQQEHFKKQHDLRRSSSISSKSKIVADKICNQYRHVNDKSNTTKKKRVGNQQYREIKNKKSSSSEICIAKSKTKNNSESEYEPSEGDYDSDYEWQDSHLTPRKPRHKSTTNLTKLNDDGCAKLYKARLDLYYCKLEEENLVTKCSNEESKVDHHALSNRLKVYLPLWENLYEYQQEGIDWLWQLHQKPTGGLLGDEMGLGKTVQVITFLHSLEYSKIVSGQFIGLGPSIIVCPATVIHQWLEHFYEWAPEFRVAILHQSGTYQGNKIDLIKEIHKTKGILITTYQGLSKYKGHLLDLSWHYLILDEGHKIRNASSKMSVAVKQFRTPHKLLLTGSPMQNNLGELWSLFDFTNPGMLGDFNTFQEHFAGPILQGGFANANEIQEATALSVATTLKSIITPYLLRRSKEEVQSSIKLPHKTEQVLFCTLTAEQRDLYKGFLMSEHVNTILGRGTQNHSDNYIKGNILVAITTLRKICNHPDLYLVEADEQQDEASLSIEDRFGYYKRSGKMIVVSALLKIWKKQKHRVLLFSQGRAMIGVFQDFLEQNHYSYLKLDGSTPIGTRQSLINKFNGDASVDVFLLTTRVGGLGVNLTGANRVIIYDPDWNPATDTQARERAWRIGQEKQVTIYRLLSSGTIEEKMYQRQVWKQLLSNKVLIDPKTQRFFKSSDLYDLFSLQDSQNINPESTNIFHESRVKIEQQLLEKKKQKEAMLENVEFSEDKIQAMKNLAAQISKKMSQENKEKECSTSKSSFQVELEEEHKRKLMEKEKLKKLTPVELMMYNRNKPEVQSEQVQNSIDDSGTSLSFSKALEYSGKTAKLYQDLNHSKIDISKKRKLDEGKDEKAAKRKKNSEKRNIDVDISGKIDGEVIQGLVKSEIRRRKVKKPKETAAESQDNFILETLFSKKGVLGALQHEHIVKPEINTQSLKIHSEAKLKANKSLEALRKSRLGGWRW